MSGFITYIPKEQWINLQKANDTGPITVVFGSIHTKMPSIKSVKVGDIIYPVTLIGGVLNIIARLPIEEIEDAYYYLIRKIGNRCGALIPNCEDGELYYDTPMLPHKEHQIPFNCCSQLAATGTKGSSIKLRPIPAELTPSLRFGPKRGKEKGLKPDKNGNISIMSVSSVVRRMSEDTQKIFESLFDSEISAVNEDFKN